MRLYPITIDVNRVTSDMISWAETQDATVTDDVNKKRVSIQFPNSKPSVSLSDGSMRIHLHLSQKNTAMIFLLLFDEYIVRHNMKELETIKDIYATA